MLSAEDALGRGIGLKPRQDRDYLVEYVIAAAESATRVRFVMIVIVIMSVVSFGAFWNSQSVGWSNSRLQTLQDVRHWWPLLSSDSSALRDSAAKQMLPDELRRFRRASAYLEARSGSAPLDTASLGELTKVLQERQARDVMTVRLPLFGNAFDINDLGFLAGFGLSVAMIWLAFSTSSELRNVRTVFARAGEAKCGTTCYELLAMRQVLTSPPTQFSDYRWWKPLPRMLNLLPMIVQTLIFGFDIYTFDKGLSLSKGGTLFSLLTGGMAWAFIVVMTFVCLRLSRDVESAWHKAARDFGIVPT